MKSQSSSSPTDKHYNNDATADSTTMETLKGWPVWWLLQACWAVGLLLVITSTNNWFVRAMWCVIILCCYLMQLVIILFHLLSSEGTEFLEPLSRCDLTWSWDDIASLVFGIYCFYALLLFFNSYAVQKCDVIIMGWEDLSSKELHDLFLSSCMFHFIW